MSHLLPPYSADQGISPQQHEKGLNDRLFRHLGPRYMFFYSLLLVLIFSFFLDFNNGYDERRAAPMFGQRIALVLLKLWNLILYENSEHCDIRIDEMKTGNLS